MHADLIFNEKSKTINIRKGMFLNINCLAIYVCLFDLILYVPSTIFQLNRDGSSWVEPVLSWDKCVLLKDHNTVTSVRLEPAALRSRVKHSTTEPLRSLLQFMFRNIPFLILLAIYGKFPEAH